MTSSLIETLSAIRDQHGTLTPALVVDAARDPQSPLHSRFEWDDTKAARKWRLEQAGQLLRVTFRPDPQKPNDLRAFMAIKGKDSPTSEYVPTTEALSDPFARELLLRQMKRDAQAFASRYRHMAEYAAVVAALIQSEPA